ncbi:MAG: hypothetical protein LBQ22_11435 [Bacteroidales bacterium]|jgi:hypothetical protein|nr:hypothetical protein [Bacteroidales bacterium]
MFVTLRGQTGNIIPGTNSSYPYAFMDENLLGWTDYIMTFFILASIFIILGYFIFFIDRMIGRSKKI